MIPVGGLVADCGRCVALCCVAPAFARSADFAIDKPAGRPCPNLAADHRCGIHDRLRPSGFAGCTAYDCFGAGQQTVQVTFGGRAEWSARTFRVFEVLRQLHELLWYATDALDRPAAAPVHPELAAVVADLERRTAADPGTLEATDPAASRARVAPLLRRASTLTRAALPGRQRPKDLAGRELVAAELRGAVLRGADLSTAVLLGADLRDADLSSADLLAADLRGADLRGADLSDALYLTHTQLGGTRGDARTTLPRRLRRPSHWAG